MSRQTPAEPREYRVVANNTATTSSNKIHDDAVARQYGFAGALVPGVDVYAYMTRPVAGTWGIDWLRAGSMRARFLQPVYHGETVTVTPTPCGADRDVVTLELRNHGGTVCAVGEARRAAEHDTSWPDASTAVQRSGELPPASPASLAPGTALALAPHTFDADGAVEYLADVGDDLALYAAEGVAHPGWLLRDANSVLLRNVALGPWIHVESVTEHHGLVGDGDAVETSAVVRREWERKGHRFVELDVAITAAGRPAARIVHTAIYQPRRADDAS